MSRAGVVAALDMEARSLGLRTRRHDGLFEVGDGILVAVSGMGRAAAVAAARLKRTGRSVTVSLPGGDLAIEWRASDDHVLMTGPVEYEHKGRFDAALFADAGAP